MLDASDSSRYVDQSLFFAANDAQRDETLYRMFEMLRAGSVGGAGTTDDARLRPMDAQFALRCVLRGTRQSAVRTRESASSFEHHFRWRTDDEIAIKGIVAAVLLGDEIDPRTMTPFELSAVFDNQSNHAILDFDGFAACFDDARMPLNAPALLKAAIAARTATLAASARLATEEASIRTRIAGLEVEERMEHESNHRRARDIIMLRKQIEAAGLRHRREARLQDVLQGTAANLGADGDAAVTTLAAGGASSVESVRAEAEKVKHQREEYLTLMTRFEEASASVEEAVDVAQQQLQVLKRWVSTSLTLARQQHEESIAAIVDTVNCRRPAVENSIASLEAKVNDLAEMMLAAAAKSRPDELRRFVRQQQQQPAASPQPSLGAVFASEMRESWDLAASLSLDSPQLPLCDPANTTGNLTWLSDHLTSTLAWVFRRYASHGAARAPPSLEPLYPVMEDLEDVTLDLDGFVRFVREHDLAVPGTPKLAFTELAVGGSLNFGGFVRLLHNVAQLMHGNRASRFSVPFALYCLVQAAIECRQLALLFARTARRGASDEETVMGVASSRPWTTAHAVQRQHRDAFASMMSALQGRAAKGREQVTPVDMVQRCGVARRASTVALDALGAAAGGADGSVPLSEMQNYALTVVNEALLIARAPAALASTQLSLIFRHSFVVGLASLVADGGESDEKAALELADAANPLVPISLCLAVWAVMLSALGHPTPLPPTRGGGGVAPRLCGTPVLLFAVAWLEPMAVIEAMRMCTS